MLKISKKIVDDQGMMFQAFEINWDIYVPLSYDFSFVAFPLWMRIDDEVSTDDALTRSIIK